MRRTIFCLVGLLCLLSVVSLSLAQDVPLSITGMKADPATARPGSNVLLSCRVVHPDGPANIERVAATVFDTSRTTAFPMLYDDGTHGDKSPRDGVYSLLITVSKNMGERRVVFHALDTQKHEVESQPVFFTVKQQP